MMNTASLFMGEMMLMLQRIACVLLLLAMTTLSRADALPAGGRMMAQGVSGFSTGKLAHGEITRVHLDKGPSQDALRLACGAPGNPWDVEAHNVLPMGVQKKEVLLLHFWARMIQSRHESGQAIVSVTLALSESPYTAVVSQLSTVGPQWQEFYLPAAAEETVAAGTLALKISAGYAAQTLEVAGVELLNFGNAVKVSDLPRTRTSYAGREASAAWRAAAEERIAQLRMAPITLKVIDAAGRPVPDAQVNVILNRHAFEFGCAIEAWHLLSSEPRYRMIQKKFPEMFNAGSFTNSLKWPAWNGDWGENLARNQTMDALRWVKAHDLAWRGHVLMWPSYRNMPESIHALKNSATPAAINDLTMAHIDEITSATSGYLTEWDVLNEPRDNHDLMDLCGRTIMADWFKRARADLPGVRLTLNDYGILSAMGDDPAQKDYEQIARGLIEQGAPLDVLGFQGHFAASVPPPTRVLAVLDHFAALGKKIRITEFDIAGDDQELQADFLRDMLTVAFSHPSVIGMQFWGYDQLLNADGSLTPMGRAYTSLVLKKWRTHVTSTTDSAGQIRVRGFQGRYEYRIIRNGREQTGRFLLPADGQNITVLLK